MKFFIRHLSKLLVLTLNSFTLYGCSIEKAAGQIQGPFLEKRCTDFDRSDDVTITVVNLGWHTGLIIPTEKLTSKTRQLVSEFQLYPLVEVGWGDRDFYMSESYSSWLGIKALFFSSGSVIHLAGFNIHTLHEHTAETEAAALRINQAGFAKLEDYIIGHLEKHTPITPLGKSLYGNGNFYAALGEFGLSRTCNAWTAAALSKAGCSVNTKLSRASSLMKELSRLPSASNSG